ncbi:hypothetical protein [Gluconobacter cerinus]|uniref:hypothetical protein n=1 Tax=Gluconobacter cerinus TaxID=38307 RepID=UPI003AB75B09
MIFLYLVVAAVWCFFWVKGRLWAALPVVAFWVWFIGTGLTQKCAECGFTDTIPNPLGFFSLVIVSSLAAFGPYAIQRRRAARMDRALNGLRLTDAD